MNEAAGPTPSPIFPGVQSQHCSKAPWFVASQEQEATLVHSAFMAMNLTVLLKKRVEQITRPTDGKCFSPLQLDPFPPSVIQENRAVKERKKKIGVFLH